MRFRHGSERASAAAAERFETEVVIIGGEGGPEGFVIFGVLFSDKEKCVANRQMSLVAEPNAAPRGTTDFVYDTARSSGNGAWGLLCPGQGAGRHYAGHRGQQEGPQERNGVQGREISSHLA